MAWYQYYLDVDGTPTSLATTNITPPSGQSVVEVSATEDPPEGVWNPSSLQYEPLPDFPIINAEEFKSRFTETEWNDFVGFARGASPGAVMLDGLKAYMQSGLRMNLSASIVINAVNQMEEVSSGPILASGRAAEILDIDNQPSL